jgi:RHS repeat-associated protein
MTIFIFLNAEEPILDPYLTAALSSEPTSIVGGCVNAITGDFVFSSKDLTAEGIEPLSLQHVYTSRFRNNKFPSGQFFFQHLVINCFDKNIFIIIEPSGIKLQYNPPAKSLNISKDGKRYFHSNISLNLSPDSLKGLANASNLESSGRVNLKNNKVVLNQAKETITIECPDGSTRYYIGSKHSFIKMLNKKYGSKKDDNYYADYFFSDMNILPLNLGDRDSYFLKEEKLSNGNRIIYDYDDLDRLTNAKLLTPSKTKSLSDLSFNNDTFTCTSSCDKSLKVIANIEKTKLKQIYDWSKKKKKWKTRDVETIASLVCTSKISSENPNISFEYKDSYGKVISDYTFPDKRQIHIEYYTLGNYKVNNININIPNAEHDLFMKVKSIGIFDDKKIYIPLYSFIYHPGKVGETGGSTEVYDSDNNKTIYTYSENLQPETIERYVFENNQYFLKNSENLIWGKEGTSDFTFLLCKNIFDSQGGAVFSKRFFYDANGNIVKEIFYGNISGLTNKTIRLENGFPKDNGIETFTKSKTYSNDNRNLLIVQTDDSGLIESYSYLDGTDKILSKLISYKDITNIKKRIFYEYDEDNILIKEITDDGSSIDKNDFTKVSKRLIKVISPIKDDLNYGMTSSIEESYLDPFSEHQRLFKKEKFFYNENRRIIKKDIYGSDNSYKYSLEYTYDKKGNLATETNPIGQKAFYTYDLNNNKIGETDFSGKKISYEYDNLNRLIKKTIGGIDQKYTEIYEYDLKNNKISETDIYGNTTYYKYDAFNNLIEEIFPFIQDAYGKLATPTKIYKYDDLNRQIEKIDSLTNTAKITYNALNKPILIEYPDGTTEKNIYNKDGTLKENINQEGTKTKYEYDYQKRVILKTILPSDGQRSRIETFEYDAFNLISKTDPDGNILKYFYDGALRKSAEEFLSKDNKLLSIEQYYYNDLGFLSTKTEGFYLETRYVIDNSGRILEEKKDAVINEILFDRLYEKLGVQDRGLFKIRYEYDEAGNKNLITSFIAGNKSLEKKEYDIFNRLIKITDAMGNLTTIYYPFEKDRKNKIVITENALKQKTIQTYDAIGREIKIEKINPEGSTISLEEKIYDLNSNLTGQKSTVYDLSSLKPIKQIETYFEYDSMNRLTLLKEAYNSKDEKTTSYAYTKAGLLKTTTKPDKTILTNEYDSFDNKIRLYSSKNDIDYAFHYNNINQLIEAKDNIANKKTSRKYDASGSITEETLASGLKVRNRYDLFGNRTKCFLPDKTSQKEISIEYTYDPLNLKQIVRKDSDGNVLYTHEFLMYDLSSNLLLEKLINSSGEINYKLDLSGRTKSIQTKYHTQSATYDSIGRISDINWIGYEDDKINFEYDDLNQIILENGKKFSNSYLFDSHNNRLKKNNNSYHINDINEIISIDEENFIYDKNGSPILKKKTDGKDIEYVYDSLDRLIKINGYEYRLEFTYDAFNRRISKKLIKYFYLPSPGWYETDFRYFLYDDQNEIGSFDQNLNRQELRILADTRSAEIGSAIAFEIGDEIYAPIYDISGNVVSLILDGFLKEHYRYSVFGEKKVYFNDQSSLKLSVNKLIYDNPSEYLSSQIKNPWQFSSKRLDEESGLIYFGRRYYDPTIGRWLTCDPKGFIDGLNLYAFVLNDPLIKYDLYGLYAIPGMFPNSPAWANDAAGAGFHRTADFGAGTINFMSDVGFGLSSTFLYGYRTFTGGSFANDYKMHWLEKANLRSDVQSFMQRIIPVNLESKAYQRASNVTDLVLNGMALGSGIGGIYKGASAFTAWTLNSIERSALASKSLFTGAKNNMNKIDLLSQNKAYSGIDFEQLIKNVKNNLSKDAIQQTGWRLNPDINATGAHSVFKRMDGKIVKYSTFSPQSNPRNPTPWEVMKRFDGNPIAYHEHHSKFFKENIKMPHIHDPTFPGKIRYPYDWETPK